MNGGLRGTPTANCLKNVVQMDKANPYKNGIPKDLPNKAKDNHWVGEVDEKQAEESLSLYCKPVELYNLIQQRAEQKPLFLQRCLSYKQSAAWQRRIRITISVTGHTLGKSRGKDTVTTNGTIQCSLFVMVTTPVTCSTEERSMEPGLQGQVYRLRETQMMKIGRNHHSSSTAVSFILPELRQLTQGAENRDVVLFVLRESVDGGTVSQVTTIEKLNGCVVWGKMGISSLFVNMLRHTKDDAQRKVLDGNYAEIKSNVELRHGNLQLEDSNLGKTIRLSTMSRATPQRSLVQLTAMASGVEVGRTTVQGRPTNGTIPKSHLPYSLSHAWRPRIGRVVFHYIYYHDMRRKTEVTEGFSCPFCLNGCASFKGLRGHLNASHDLFNFEYLVSGELQVVNVTCRSDVIGSQGIIRDVDGLSDPRMKNFCYWNPRSQLRRRRLPVSLGNSWQAGKSPSTWMQASDLAEEQDLQQRSVLQETADLNNESVDTTTLPVAEVADASDQPLGDHLLHKPSIKVPNGITMKGLKHGNNISSTLVRKRLRDADGLAVAVKQRDMHAPKRQRMKGVLGERVHARSRPTFGGACASAGGGQDLDDCGQQHCLVVTTKAMFPDIPRIHNLLQKRQYFHSHTAQPMDAEQLFEDRDSEDEVDTVIADLEDRRMLDDFVDVTPEEKEVMHLWNSFVRRNRVVADGHCPWACGEFSRENAQRFGENPALRRCLMLFLVKLWNHHLVDGPTISQCLAIVDLNGSNEKVQKQ